MSKLGDKIKEIRLKAGLTQEEFGKTLGYTNKSSITKIEKGVNEISFDKLELLVEKYHVDMYSLFENKIENSNRVENAELTVLCLIEDNDKILLLNRKKDDWKGYTLPGGLVEKKESFVDAVKREIKEETGLSIMNPKLCGIKQFPIENGRYIVLLFKAIEFEGELKPSNEGDVEWIEYKDLKKLDTVKDFDVLLEVINSNNLNEFQYIIENNEWKALIQ